jgi:3-dehydroquinate synthase
MMKKNRFRFSGKPVDYYFNTPFARLSEIVDKAKTVLITDEHVFKAHQRLFKGWDTIVLKPGEAFKVQRTVDEVIDQLITLGADRLTQLVGVGGGVVTDITGYVAGIYMRGIPVGFVPTSLLAMVDASIGGKNGIDVGLYKNMVGLIRQPSFLLFDPALLKTLPLAEWQNGFAEIIKHACIKDAAMFKHLQQYKIRDFQKDPSLLAALIERNVRIKTRVVVQDEFEQGDRKLLNFGHTLGHAIENMYALSHGQAISIGMVYAAKISEQIIGYKDSAKLESLLQQYGLPTSWAFDARAAFQVLQKDKKKAGKNMQYILLEKTGKGIVYPIPLAQLETIFNQF